MSNNKLKSLGLIQRLRRHELEQEASQLGALRHQISLLQTEKANLLNLLKRDTTMQSVDLAQYIGDFIRSVRKQVKIIDGKISELHTRADKQENVVIDKFGRVKGLDIVAENEKVRSQKELNRKTEAERDDMVVMRWAR